MFQGKCIFAGKGIILGKCSGDQNHTFWFVWISPNISMLHWKYTSTHFFACLLFLCCPDKTFLKLLIKQKHRVKFKTLLLKQDHTYLEFWLCEQKSYLPIVSLLENRVFSVAYGPDIKTSNSFKISTCCVSLLGTARLLFRTQLKMHSVLKIFFKICINSASISAI